MEQNLHNPEVYDYRQYDRIWQRVAPGLEPYSSHQGIAVPSDAPAHIPANTAPVTHSQIQQESQLPGATPDPCCMGTAAAEILEVLVGFIEMELDTQRHYCALIRQASTAKHMAPARQSINFRQQLRELSAEAGSRAKRLMAVYYLITGECYHPNISCQQVCPGHWCTALRELFHLAACAALNYARAAESTTDPCLTRLLNQLSADQYRQADCLTAMLERSLRS